MARAQAITKDVRFYRVLAAIDAGTPKTDIGVIDWASILRQFGARAVENRQATHLGQTEQFNTDPSNDRALVPIRKRQVGDIVVYLDDATGDVTERPVTQDGKTLGDHAVVVFVPGANMFGYVASTREAPRPQVVARWLAMLQPFAGGELDFAVEPIVTKPELDALRDAWGGRRVSVSVPVGSFGGLDSDLGEALANLADKLDEGTIKIEISSGHRHPKPKFARDVLALADELSGALGPDAKADASVLHEERTMRKRGKNSKPEEVTVFRTEVIELVQSELAFPVPLALSESADTMIERTVAAVERVITAYRGQLLAASAPQGDGEADGAADPAS